MLLKELFERSPLNTKPISIPTIEDIYDRISTQDGRAVGGFTSVFINNQDNVVVKVYNMGKKADSATIRFVNLGLKHNNPFLPFIYDGQIYLTNKGEHVLVFTTEKLHELNSVDKNVSQQLFKRIGIDLDKLKSSKYKGNIALLFHSKKGREGFQTGSRNEYIKQAVNILNPIFDEFGSDMRIENWMIRFTSYGPQLVLNDPILPASLGSFKHQKDFQLKIGDKMNELDIQWSKIKIDNENISDVILRVTKQVYPYTQYLYGNALKQAVPKFPEPLKQTIKKIVTVTKPLATQILKALKQLRNDEDYNENADVFFDEFRSIQDALFTQNMISTGYF